MEISKESKWFNRLRTYEREHLAKKHPMTNEYDTFEKWVTMVYNKEKK